MPTQKEQFGRLCNALRDYGMTIPAEVDNFANLVIAIKANSGSEAGFDESGGGFADAEEAAIFSAFRPSLPRNRRGSKMSSTRTDVDGRPITPSAREQAMTDFLCDGIPSASNVPIE